jgi:hypothetical protein
MQKYKNVLDLDNTNDIIEGDKIALEMSRDFNSCLIQSNQHHPSNSNNNYS